MIIILMGVSGSGKTTVGQLLSTRLNIPFHDADSFHPPANVAKMSSGQPLSDEDRQLWLQALATAIAQWAGHNETVVLACSALKKNYRDVLTGQGPSIAEQIRFVFLTGSESLLRQRIEARQGHYMPAGLLTSQLDALETPSDALTVDIAATPQQIAQQIIDVFELTRAENDS